MFIHMQQKIEFKSKNIYDDENVKEILPRQDEECIVKPSWENIDLNIF